MKIIVDGEAKIWSYDGAKTLEEVVIDINERLIADSMLVLSEVKVDNFDSSLDPSLTWDKVSIESIQQISLTTEPLSKRVSKNLSDAGKVIAAISKNIPEITKNLSADNIDAGMTAFKENIDGLIWIFDIIKQSEAIGVEGLSEMKVGDTNFSSFMERFNSTLMEIFDSMTNKDMTLINDFLEYELEPSVKDLGKLLAELKSRVDNLSGAEEG